VPASVSERRASDPQCPVHISRQPVHLICAFESSSTSDDAAALKNGQACSAPMGGSAVSPAHQGRYGPADELVGHFRRYIRRHDALLATHASPRSSCATLSAWLSSGAGATWSAGGGSPRLRPCRSPSDRRSGRLLHHPAAFACRRSMGPRRRWCNRLPEHWHGARGPGRSGAAQGGKDQPLTATAVVRRLPWTGRSGQRAGRATR